MARISNCGKSEDGGVYGQPGDQTTQEYWNINYWANGWKYVFRYPAASIASAIAMYAEHAAANDHLGYSWSGRETMWQQISFLTSNCMKPGSGGIHDPMNINADCNADCSSSTMAVIRAVGLDKNVPALAGANISWTTGAMIEGLESLGFRKMPFTGENNLRTGDILMTDGHACIVISGNCECGPEELTDEEPFIPEEQPVEILYMSLQLPIIKPNMAGLELEAVNAAKMLLNEKAGAGLELNKKYDEDAQEAFLNWQLLHPSCGIADKEIGALGWKSLITEN